VLREILRGGLEKMKQAGVALIGVHSVDDPELKYGLSVTGVVNPKRLITNGGAVVGDRLILTKPLGTGIISTALKNGAVPKPVIDRITESMATLNDRASALMLAVETHSCTDITGFGFLGHALQMAQNSGVGFAINAGAVPFFPEAVAFSEAGFLPGGLQRNRDYYSSCVKFGSVISEHVQRILSDPQTSGGLLISVGAASAAGLLLDLKGVGLEQAAIIGDVVAEPRGKVVLS
jgi:selenide,water dikinase